MNVRRTMTHPPKPTARAGRISAALRLLTMSLLLAVPAALSPSAAMAQHAVKISLQGRFDGTTAPFFVAQDRGFYAAEGLQVTIEPGTTGIDSIANAANGRVDIALADINALIRYRDQMPASTVKAIFVVHNKPTYAIIGRKSRGVTMPKDLEGKTLAAPATDNAVAQWTLFAKLNGIDAAKVRIENVAPPVREPMLASGQVDAIAGSTTASYIDLKDRGVPVDDIVVLPMSEYGLDLFGASLVADAKFLTERPEVARAFLRAFTRGLKATIRDPARAVDSALTGEEPVRKDIELERLRLVLQSNVLTPEVTEFGLGAANPARLQSAIDQIAQTYTFKAKPKPDDIFDASFLPAAEARKPH
jgi:NitT/TauT family transport system substrate-binding protein